MRFFLNICILALLLSTPAFAIEDQIASGNEGAGPHETMNTQMRESVNLKQIQRKFDGSDSTANYKEYPYDRKFTYKLRLREFMNTSVVLPEGENIKAYSLGDSQNFAFSAVRLTPDQPTNIFEVWGKYPGADTSLKVYGESGNIYSFYLRIDSVESDFDPTLTAYILADPIQSKNNSFSSEKTSAGEETPKDKYAPKKNDQPLEEDYLRELADIDPTKLNFDYQIADTDSDLAPMRIFDDGSFTYFQFGEENLDDVRSLPLVYRVMDGSDSLVNTQKQGGFVIATTTHDKWTLRSGDKYLCVREKAMTELVPSVPKIKPGFFTPKVLLLGIMVLVLLGSVAYGAYYKLKNQGEPTEIVLTKHNGGIEIADWLKEPKPQPKPKPEPKPKSTPILQKPKPVLKRVEPTPPPPTADQLFNPVQPLPQDNRHVAINEARRGATSIRVSADIYGQPARTETTMSQEVWDEEQTVASYPVNMERVIPLYMNIPALLLNEINSEKAGKVVAQVEQHIYGGQGRKILIPAGSMAVGYYAPLEKVGEERLVITWIRIITPSGINIKTVNAEMADAMGRAGITGDIDNKYWERYGLALLVTTIQMAAAYTFPVKNDGQKILVENYGSSVGSMGQKVLDENIKIKPTLTIKAGSRILISPLKDIWFPKPVKKTIHAVAMEDHQ